MLRIFTGFDQREAVGLHVFTQSLHDHASVPFSITSIGARLLPAREGSNAFTWARFALPALMGFQGWAIFMDGMDMLVRADIAELADMRDRQFAVQCVKHDYKTINPRKYRGTPMECPNLDYPRKQWASMMIINCGHPAWRDVDDTLHTLQLRHIPSDAIGELPVEWNWLADEQGRNDNAKVVHFTAGIPAFAAHAGAAHAGEWFETRARAMRATG